MSWNCILVFTSAFKKTRVSKFHFPLIILREQDALFILFLCQLCLGLFVAAVLGLVLNLSLETYLNFCQTKKSGNLDIHKSGSRILAWRMIRTCWEDSFCLAEMFWERVSNYFRSPIYILGWSQAFVLVFFEEWFDVFTIFVSSFYV